MRITELLKKESIELGVKVSGKEEAIDKLIGLMAAGGRLNDKAGYKEGILAREALGSTAVGEGIAIPHAKVAAVKEPGLAAMVVPDGVDYEAFDGSLANLIFMIAAPEGEADVHLEALSRLSTLLMDPDFKNDLTHAESKEEFLQLIDDKESERYEKKVRKEEKKAEDSAPKVQEPLKSAAGYRVLAVTACPTGIAHTFMAAENLEQLGKKLGIPVKSETNGAEGAANVLTKEEIAAADGIIIAADKNVDMARFDGKHVVKASVSDGIQKGEELIKKAVSGEAPVYHHTGAAASEEGGESEGIGHTIYKHLMNGVSHMLPFVIGGGILIALSFLVDSANAGAADFGSGTPLALFFHTVGNTAFGMMFPILAGYIAMAIADRPALMPGIVGGLLAKAGTSVFLPEDQWVSSGFFGALIAGFVAGYLMVLIKKLLDKLPKSLEGTKPVLLYPFLGILAMGAIMIFLVNPPVGAFNTWLNDMLAGMGESSKILLGAVLGGMMSIDFGGPFNKAAYVFGTAAIASGQIDIMAAVMIGGMTPPIGIALATTFFKNRFTKSEKQTTVTNYIMGLSFITEGAIPFAASDPLRIIPPCVVGSAVAGALSMAFGCGSRAPHGGIFVIGIVENAPMFLLALAIGAVVTMAGIILLKKPLPVEKQ